MLKKTILIIAIAALAVPAFGAVGFLDGKKIEAGFWPSQYVPQGITKKIPVYMNIGYYVEVQSVEKIKIYLNQVDYNTYEGSKKFKIRANFEALIGAEIEDLGLITFWSPKLDGVETDIIESDPMIGFSARVGDGGGDGEDEVIQAGSSWNELELFAAVNGVNMMSIEGGPDCELKVAEITLTVVPNSLPPGNTCVTNKNYNYAGGS